MNNTLTSHEIKLIQTSDIYIFSTFECYQYYNALKKVFRFDFVSYDPQSDAVIMLFDKKSFRNKDVSSLSRFWCNIFRFDVYTDSPFLLCTLIENVKKSKMKHIFVS